MKDINFIQEEFKRRFKIIRIIEPNIKYLCLESMSETDYYFIFYIFNSSKVPPYSESFQFEYKMKVNRTFIDVCTDIEFYKWFYKELFKSFKDKTFKFKDIKDVQYNLENLINIIYI